MQHRSHAFRVTPPIPIPKTLEAAASPGPAGTREGAGCSRRSSWDLQVGDSRFTDGGGDGFDGRAEGVEELRELPGAFRPPAFLHHEAGHGDDIGVESGAVRHGGSAARVEPPPPSPPPLAPAGRGLGVAGGGGRR